MAEILTPRKNITRAGLALLAVISLSACSHDHKNTEARSNPITTQVPVDTTLGSGEYERVGSYLVSNDRQDAISQAVQTAGARIVKAAQTGEMGPFDFYNVQTKKWGRNKGNEGWGFLQHNPQYGGSNNQVAITVYQNNDGSVALEKGVQSLTLHSQDTSDPAQTLEFTSPLESQIISGITVHDYWDVDLEISSSISAALGDQNIVPPHTGTLLTTADANTKTVDQVRVLDQTALAVLPIEMKIFGLS